MPSAAVAAPPPGTGTVARGVFVSSWPSRAMSDVGVGRAAADTASSRAADAAMGDIVLPSWLTPGGIGHDGPLRFVRNRPMTKFERARLIGDRANQLEHGALPRATGENALAIATNEVDAGVLSGVSVNRFLNGVPVEIPVQDLERPRVRSTLW